MGEPRGGVGMDLWKEIRKEWGILHSNTCFGVGAGKKLRFWGYCWCGEEALRVMFPPLYELAVDKEDSVADVWDSESEVGMVPTFVKVF